MSQPGLALPEISDDADKPRVGRPRAGRQAGSAVARGRRSRAPKLRAAAARADAGSPFYYKHGVFLVPYRWRQCSAEDDDSGDDGEGLSAPRRHVLSRWAALSPWPRPPPRRRPPRRPGRHHAARRCLGRVLARALAQPDHGAPRSRRCLRFLAEFLRLKLRLRLFRAPGLAAATWRSVNLAPKGLQAPAQPGVPGEWQVLEAVVRVVLGATLQDLVRRFALVFLAHKEAVAVPPALPPAASTRAPPVVGDPARRRGTAVRRMHRPAQDAVKSEMALRAAASATGAAKSRSAPGPPSPTSPRTSTSSRPARTTPCRCSLSRYHLEQLALASSGDSPDLNPPPVKHSHPKEGTSGGKGGAGISDRPPWRNYIRPSSLALPSPPSRTPPVSPLASPRRRGPDRATGDAPAAPSAPAKAARSATAKTASFDGRRKEPGDAAPQRPQSSVQVLYVPPRVAPTPSELGDDDGAAVPRSWSTPSRPSVRQAETQTTSSGSETCARALRSQVLDMRGFITRLQGDMASLMVEDHGEEQRQQQLLLLQQRKWMEAVQFWQKRYEDLNEEHRHCQLQAKEKRR